MTRRIEKFLFAGPSGYGLLRAGRALVAAGLARGFEVSWLPERGASLDGYQVVGTAILARKAVDSPLVSVPDFALTVGTQAAQRLYPTVKTGGRMLEGTLAEAPQGIPQTRDDIQRIPVPLGIECQQAELRGMEAFFLLGGALHFSEFLQAEDLAAWLSKDPGSPRERTSLRMGAEFVAEKRYMKDLYALSIFSG